MCTIDTDRDIKVDYEQLVSKGNDVLGLDVEMGNTMAMQKCDTLYQLPTEIHNVAAKHPECEAKIQGSGFGEKDKHRPVTSERHK